MFRGRVLRLAAGVWCAGMVGCGGGAPAGPGSAAPLASNLGGNWLLAGVLPTQPLTPPKNFGLAMSFAVNGTEVVGSGSAQFLCSGVDTGLTFGGLVQGTVGADGTFTVKTPTAVNGGGLNLVVTGSVPKTAGGPWSGTYSLQSAPLGPVNACTFAQSATFTASPLANVEGKYVGTGTLIAPLGQTNVPVTVTMNLQQGATITTTAGVSAYDATLLSGTVQVAGTPCFSSGTIGPFTGTPGTSVGTVEGSQVVATFNMDDGSRMRMDGSMADTEASKIVQPLLIVTGGACAAAANTSVVLRVTELDKVS